MPTLLINPAARWVGWIKVFVTFLSLAYWNIWSVSVR